MWLVLSYVSLGIGCILYLTSGNSDYISLSAFPGIVFFMYESFWYLHEQTKFAYHVYKGSKSLHTD